MIDRLLTIGEHLQSAANAASLECITKSVDVIPAIIDQQNCVT
jgi:hypothetical protein